MDDVNGRFLLSLRPSDLYLSLSLTLEEAETKEKMISLLQDFFQVRNTILSDLKGHKVSSSIPSSGVSLTRLATSFCPGGRSSGHVTSVDETFAIIDLEEGVVAKANLLAANGQPGV